MLIKEYRMCMPFTVEEFRIAQRFLVARSSKQRTLRGERVEILKNEPFSDENGTGQYTHKVYHVGNSVPSWTRAIIPANALAIEEQAWNCYPRTRTIMSCPFFGEKLKIEVITIFCDDRGEQENIFQLDQATLKKRTVDVIDLAYDDVSHLKMEHNTDPTTFNSTRTGRGPLPRGWQKTTSPVMCSYKICYAEFNYWGFQSKVEQFIHQFALRDNILKGHREAFCWIDEWYDLTMADIDRIELETQQELALLNAQILSGDAPSSSSPQAPATQKPDGPNDLPTTSAMDSNKREQSGAVKDDNVEKSPDARRMSNEFKVGSHVPVQHQVARSRSDSSNSTNRVPEQRRSSLSGNQNDQILIAPPSLPDLRRSSISVAQPDQRRASVAITPTDQRSTTPVSLPDQRRSSISVAHPDHRRDSNTLVAPSQVSMYPQPMPEQRRISANFASPIISNNQQRPVIDATRKQKTVQSFANVDPNDFLANLVLQYERETAAIHCDTSDSNDEFFDGRFIIYPHLLSSIGCWISHPFCKFM
eukprot:TRINITY_DN3667_c0_g1_i3.p1 TRINITY_DN3667_c0_g1~~TRINITY_DN3667_c0_g1_i3.p1  ORF type:complete len:532 (+),score=64.84 TRINITY_DN3667_c0_g1_i3:94-1689(+)